MFTVYGKLTLSKHSHTIKHLQSHLLCNTTRKFSRYSVVPTNPQIVFVVIIFFCYKFWLRVLGVKLIFEWFAHLYDLLYQIEDIEVGNTSQINLIWQNIVTCSHLWFPCSQHIVFTSLKQISFSKVIENSHNISLEKNEYLFDQTAIFFT